MDRWDECRNYVDAWFRRWPSAIRRWFEDQPQGPSIDIDVLAQEVFVRLQRDREDAGVDDPLRHLQRIADEVANEWLGNAKQCQPNDRYSPEKLLPAENTIVQAVARQRLQAAVQSLPERQRELLLLHFQDGLTCKQIVVKKGLTYRAVLQGVTNAYVRLRLQLELQGDDASGERRESAED